MQYCTTNQTKVPHLFGDESGVRQPKLIGQLQVVCGQSKAAEMATPQNPAARATKAQSCRHKMKSFESVEALPQRKPIAAKRCSMDTSPVGVRAQSPKSPQARFNSPVRCAATTAAATTVVTHSPLDLSETTNIKVFARFRPLSRLECELTKNGLGAECTLSRTRTWWWRTCR